MCQPGMLPDEEGYYSLEAIGAVAHAFKTNLSAYPTLFPVSPPPRQRPAEHLYSHTTTAAHARSPPAEAAPDSVACAPGEGARARPAPAHDVSEGVSRRQSALCAVTCSAAVLLALWSRVLRWSFVRVLRKC